MSIENFKKWIEAGHTIYDIFEGRYNVYPICRNWVEKWYENDKFSISQDDIERLNEIRKNFYYAAFEIAPQLQQRMDDAFQQLIIFLDENRCQYNIGLGVAPYLFLWNFRRFKEYFEDERFNLSEYFQEIGYFFQDKRDIIKEYRQKKIYREEINENEIKQILNDLNDCLKKCGRNNNEPVGVAKSLHIFAPYYFPLIDNSIAKATGLIKSQRDGLSLEKYFNWIRYMKKWVETYNIAEIQEIEERHNLSILKLIDEGLYISCSIHLGSRIKILGFEIDN